MHVVVAPDKLKGSLTASEVAQRVAAGIAAVAPDVPVIQVPVADGGDGAIAAAAAAGFTLVPLRADGPTGEPVDTAFALRDGVARYRPRSAPSSAWHALRELPLPRSPGSPFS